MIITNYTSNRAESIKRIAEYYGKHPIHITTDKGNKVYVLHTTTDELKESNGALGALSNEFTKTDIILCQTVPLAFIGNIMERADDEDTNYTIGPLVHLQLKVDNRQGFTLYD